MGSEKKLSYQKSEKQVEIVKILPLGLFCGGIPGELRGPVTGDDIGAPETGVPGLLPMCLGEFIMGGPVTGEDMGKEVAGLPGLGLAMAPGGIPRGPPGPW